MMRAAYLATWRLCLRSIWLWAVTAAASLLLLLVSMGGTQGATGVLVAFHQQGLVSLIFFLGQMFAVVTLVRQERAGRAAESLEALPYRPGALVAGQFFAHLAVWLAASGVLWTAATLVQVVLRGQPFDVGLLQDWLALMPASLFFSTGTAYAIGAGARRLPGAYLGAVAVFVAASLMTADAWAQLFTKFWHTGPATAFDVFLGAYFPQGGTAVTPDHLILLANRIFAVAVGASAVAWAAHSLGRRRRDLHLRRTALVFTVALAITLGSWAATNALWAPRQAEFEADSRLYAQYGAATAVLRGDGVPAVDGYDVTLKLQPAYHYLEAEAVLNVTRVGDTAVFTLGHRFDVRRVTGPDGERVAFSRSGDALLVATGGKAGRYTFQYAGDVWLWRPADRSGLRTAALLTEQGAMLPAHLGWYPMPGRQVLAEAATDQFGTLFSDGHPVHPAAPFHLSVAGAGDLQVITNAADGRPVTAAWLLLSQVPALKENGVELHLSPPNREIGRWVVQRFAPELAFYNQLMPLESPVRVVEVPDQLWTAYNPRTPMSGYADVVLLPSSDLAVTRDGGYWFLTRTRLMTLWWGAPRTGEEVSAQQVLDTFLLDLYRQENPGAPANPFTPDTVRQLADELLRFDADHGRQATARLLASFRHPDKPLTHEAIKAAVKGAQP